VFASRPETKKSTPSPRSGTAPYASTSLAMPAAAGSRQRRRSRTAASNAGGSHQRHAGEASCSSKTCESSQAAPAAPIANGSRIESYGSDREGALAAASEAAAATARSAGIQEF